MSITIDIFYRDMPLPRTERRNTRSTTIDVNYLDDFDPADHPQAPAGSSKGGQFIAKGEAAASTKGFEAPDITSKSAAKYFVKPVAELKQAAKAGGTPEEIAEKIKAIASGHAHSTVATYANKIIQALEQHVGHTPGVLGKAAPKGGQAAKPEAPAAPSEPSGKGLASVKIAAVKIINNPHTYTKAEIKKVLDDIPDNNTQEPWAQDLYHAWVAKGKEENEAKKPEDKLPQPKGADQKQIYHTVAHPAASAQAKADAIAKFASKPDTSQAVKSYANLALKALGQPKLFEPPGEEKKVEPEKAPEPELPKPHEGSEPQKVMHVIATNPYLSEAEKASQLQAYVPQGPYSVKYKTDLLNALGIKEQKAQSSAAVTIPSNPSPSWKAAMEMHNNATRSESSSWDQEKARKVMPTAKQGFWNKVPPEQKEACKNYIGGSGGINGALRDPEHASAHHIEAIHAIDAAFFNPASATTEDMVVHRGLPLTSDGKQTIPVDKIKSGLAKGVPVNFQWNGFVSSSFASAAAFSSHDVQVEIGVRKGSPALAWGGSIGLGSENEVLLPHGRSFEVLSFEEIPGAKTRYRVKVVMI